MATDTAPGTELLIYDENNESHKNLQTTGKDDIRIILVPQPSLTDPNDPLRWPLWKKWVVFSHGLAYSFFGSIVGPIMSGGMVQQAAFYSIPITKLSWAAGIYLLMSGVSTMFFMPLSVKYGRRPALLASTVALGFGCIWCGVASKTTFVSFFLARAFAGLFAGPVEALLPSTVTDIFFLHDRGEKIAIYGLTLLGGYEIGPVLSAFIIQDIGLNWAFYIVAFALFANFIAIIFFMPETAYHSHRPNINTAAIDHSTPMDKGREAGFSPSTQPEKMEKGSELIAGSSDTETGAAETMPKPFSETLKFWSRDAINPKIRLKAAFLRPLVLLGYPTVLWACLVFGMALTWNIVLSLTVAQLFAPPPYAFSSSAQGLVFLSPFVGSLAGTYICGPLADRIALYYTRRNNGIREPEMGLPIAAVAAILTIVGVCIAAPCYHYQTHWIGPIVGFGVLSIGSQMGCNLSMSYALECHPELSGELMITISVVKSVLAWAWTWFINDWIVLNGMMMVYFLVALINTVVYATTILFYYKGKACRIWIQKKNLFGRTGLA
ncbi:major facilitator superfamily domain-containing protein [Ilyonectria sp. MPI-CAGE-AT-0026]|nr:major facilitator superfamily domain-containing protein [Ilyonectria sp. MPI-CAGE-AT-0026]